MPSDQNQSENDGSKRDSHGPCQDEEKWIKEYKDKVDQAVDKWMAEQKIEEAPLDKLLKSLELLLRQADIYKAERKDDAPRNHYVLAMRFLTAMPGIKKHPNFMKHKVDWSTLKGQHFDQVLLDAEESKKKMEANARKYYRVQKAASENRAAAAKAEEVAATERASHLAASGMSAVNFVALGDAMHHPALPPTDRAALHANRSNATSAVRPGTPTRSASGFGAKKSISWGPDEEFIFGVPVTDDIPVLLPSQNRMTFDTFMHRNRVPVQALPPTRSAAVAARPAPLHAQPVIGMTPEDQFNAQLQQALVLSKQEGNVQAERLGRLKERLAKYTELELQDVDATGHCQFDALAHQIFGRFSKEYPDGASYNYRKVRNDLADWLLRNKHFNIDESGTTITDFLDHDDGETWELFVENIRDTQHKPSPTWGNHLTLIAAANLYERPIRVWSTAPGDDWWLQVDPKHYRSSHSIRPFELAHLYERYAPNLRLCHPIYACTALADAPAM